MIFMLNATIYLKADNEIRKGSDTVIGFPTGVVETFSILYLAFSHHNKYNSSIIKD